jgi:phosphohistidine phosphatase
VTVQNLILFRHAKAEEAIDAVRDEDRNLTAAGRAAALLQCQKLQALGVAPDVALVSTANRTRQTAEQAATVFPGMTVELVDDLYLASPRTIADIATRRGRHTTLVVGHNPGLHMLACDLIDGTDRSIRAALAFERLKTAELAWFIADVESRTDWTLLHFLTRDR